VNNARQELEVIYFMRPPIVQMFWDKQVIKNHCRIVINQISRASPEEKVLELQ
jgi:hypothetical protein